MYIGGVSRPLPVPLFEKAKNYGGGGAHQNVHDHGWRAEKLLKNLAATLQNAKIGEQRDNINWKNAKIRKFYDNFC